MVHVVVFEVISCLCVILNDCILIIYSVYLHNWSMLFLYGITLPMLPKTICDVNGSAIIRKVSAGIRHEENSNPVFVWTPFAMPTSTQVSLYCMGRACLNMINYLPINILFAF